MIKGIIYDMDDLMINSYPLHMNAFQVLLKQYGHSIYEIPSDIRTSFIGMRIIDIAENIIKNLKLNVKVNDFYKKRTEIFLKLVKKELKLMDGLMYSLKLFKKNNYRIGLASSGTKEYIDIVLNKFNLHSYFDVIISGDDVKKGKPDPEVYLVAVKKLGLNPRECVALEDATTGIESAKNAGCKCIAVVNKLTPPQDLSKADIVLNSLKELKIEMVRKLV